MSVMILIEGPVGAGKSTLAASLANREQAVQLNLDDWMTRLFRPDRPDAQIIEWYVQRKARCIEQIWKVAAAIVDAGGSVVLELGLIQQQSRRAFYARTDEAGYQLQVCVLDAARDIRRERVRARNVSKGTTFSMEVPDHFFEMASDMWEPPDEAETEERQIRHIDTSDLH